GAGAGWGGWAPGADGPVADGFLRADRRGARRDMERGQQSPDGREPWASSGELPGPLAGGASRGPQPQEPPAADGRADPRMGGCVFLASRPLAAGALRPHRGRARRNLVGGERGPRTRAPHSSRRLLTGEAARPAARRQEPPGPSGGGRGPGPSPGWLPPRGARAPAHAAVRPG